MNAKLRKRMRDLFDYSTTLPDVCLLMHQICTGSSDACLTPQRVREIVDFLNSVDYEWEPTLRLPDLDFDEAVKDLVKAVLVEVKRYLPGLKEGKS